MQEVRLIDNTAIMEQLRAIEQNSKLTDAQKFRSAKFVIENAPTIDAEPVRHGRWIDWSMWNESRYQCSECNYEMKYKTNFCPRCGAEMRGADNG